MPSGSCEHPVDDLLRGLAGDQPAAVRAVRHADAGVQQPQVVVDLGDRADGRARVARRRLLVDRDRGRQALDEVDVGLVHLAEELAGVRRQRLDVAALALGVDRVERERRLARPGQAGEDDQPVAGQPRSTFGGCARGRPWTDDRVGSVTPPALPAVSRRDERLFGPATGLGARGRPRGEIRRRVWLASGASSCCEHVRAADDVAQSAAPARAARGGRGAPRRRPSTRYTSGVDRGMQPDVPAAPRQSSSLQTPRRRAAPRRAR